MDKRPQSRPRNKSNSRRASKTVATAAVFVAAMAVHSSALGDEQPECPVSVTPTAGTVLTDGGAVMGVDAGDSWAFKGIPYAAPPVDELRFRPPRVHECWDDVRPATQFGKQCLQVGMFGLPVGDEDCLTLNDWAPKNTTTELLPVLFFIHGGGNTQHSSSLKLLGTRLYDGQRLAELAGAVVVTINYRLGPFGFLTHPALGAQNPGGGSGNYAILDQIAALQWVQNNAAAFGGDPDRVVLFGQSAGALNTCMLYVSPLSQGLFSAAVMQSGACFADTRAEAEDFGVQYADELGCSDAADVAGCLRDAHPWRVALTKAWSFDVAGDSGPYRPNVDGWVLNADPVESLRRGASNVPLVVGTNAEEVKLFAWLGYGNMTRPEYVEYLDSEFGPLAREVWTRYSVAEYGSPLQAFSALLADRKFVCPARRIARAAAEGNTAEVYRYHFTEVPDSNRIFEAIFEAIGPFHAMELFYLFHEAKFPAYNPSTQEVDLAHEMVGYWSRLAANQDPNGPGAVPWPVYDSASDTFLEFAETIQTGEGIRSAQCDFWDEHQ